MSWRDFPVCGRPVPTIGSRFCELCGLRDLYIGRLECGVGRNFCLYCARMRSCVLTTISRVWQEYLTWPSPSMPSYVADVCPSMAWTNMCDYLVVPRSTVARSCRVLILELILVGLPHHMRWHPTFDRLSRTWLPRSFGSVLDLIIAYVVKSPDGDELIDEKLCGLRRRICDLPGSPSSSSLSPPTLYEG